jgi:5-methylcytosine-specific restriction protein A
MNLAALLAPLRFCKQNDCPNRTREGYCPAHKQQNDQREQNRLRQHDPVNAMYGREPWPSFRGIVLAQNPICARRINGEQCHNPATLVHHLLSPRTRPDLFVAVSNVVALCQHCHPDTDTPEWKAGRDFVATRFDLTYGGKQ